MCPHQWNVYQINDGELQLLNVDIPQADVWEIVGASPRKFGQCELCRETINA